MASKFKFKLLTNEDPQAQYDAIAVKDELTFYLLNTGVGYLGEVPLFGGGAQKTVIVISDVVEEPEEGKLYVLHDAQFDSKTLTGLYFYDGTKMNSFSDELIATYLNNILVTDMTDPDYKGDDKTIATTKAIMDMIGIKLSDAEIVNAAFFRQVTAHTITADDLTNPNISLPAGTKVDDVGLLFLADTEGIDDGDEKYYFVSLTEYLTKLYGNEDSASIKMELTVDNKFKASLKIKAGEESMKVDEVNGGVYLEKVEKVDDKTPSTAKLVTEESLVRYVLDVIMPAVIDKIKDITEDMVTVDIDALNREVYINGTKYENLTEAVDDVKVGGVITLTNDTSTVGIRAVSGMNFTLDLGGNTLILDGKMTGDKGTETLGFQLLKDSSIIIKNGTIISEDAKMVIQNYSNLVLDNVIIEGRENNLYLLSNNYGNIVLRNGTKILATSGVAFDLYYGMQAVYDAGVTVTIEDNSVVIKGPIEYGKAARASEANFQTKCKLTTPLGYVLEIPEGYEWADNGNGTQTLKSITTS